MTDAPASPKKAVAKPRKPKAPAAHPPVQQMVDSAISSLKERRGSSLAAIKKYVAANFKVDIVRLAPFIRKYLKKAVVDGKLVQVKGTGASGSFKLSQAAKKEPKKKSPKKPKAKKEKAKKPKAKKTPTKKPKAKKTPTKKPKTKTTTKSKTPKKAAKPKKTPTKKPKAKKPAAKKTAKK